MCDVNRKRITIEPCDGLKLNMFQSSLVRISSRSQDGGHEIVKTSETNLVWLVYEVERKYSRDSGLCRYWETMHCGDELCVISS